MSRRKKVSMPCQEPWFSLIRTGKKRVEGRKGTPGWSSLQVEDVLVFRNGAEAFEAVVERIDRYESLDAYLEGVGVEEALPGVQSVEEGRRVYLQWSTEREILKWGFLAIWVRVR